MSDPNNNITQIDTLELDPADGQQYIVELRDTLIELLLPYQTIKDVEDRLRMLYPQSELVELAIKEASKSRSDTIRSHKVRHHSSSSGGASFTGTLHNITSFAVAKVSNLVKEGFVGSKSENEVSKFKMALIEFIIDDVLKLAGDFVKHKKGNFIITRSDIRTAMHVDKDLLDMFLSDDKSLLVIDNNSILSHLNCTTDKTSNYRHHSNQNQSLSMTYKQKVKNMVDSENTFIRDLKLIIRVFKAQLEGLPHIKNEVAILFCNINELLELSTLLLTTFEDALESVGQEDEIPYIGSEIFDFAQAEEFHAYFTFAYSRLAQKEYSEETQKEENIWREAYLKIISNDMTMTSIRTAGQYFDLAVKHLLPNYLLNTIVQFFEYYKNFCDLYELSKKHENSDDQIALRETISILFKTKKAIEELLKNKLDPKEIEPLDSKQAETIRVLLVKRLDAELQHERNLPLPYMPPPEIYRFSEPDSSDNILFEDKPDQIPVIKYATLIKLVERLTYHKYQPTIVDAFLTTYRSFIPDPGELLDLLIERFRIPDPPLEVIYPNSDKSLDDLSEIDRTNYKHYLKRFRQEYSKPVKMRVINVLKSWIKNHYYDFERHPNLLCKLHSFLDEVYNNDKILRSLIVSIRKSIDQKKICHRDELEFMLGKEPPPILWWTAKSHETHKFDILTLHPVEFARQLTLVDFDLFRAVKPSELMSYSEDLDAGKEDKYKSSPNLKLIQRHSTLLSYWIRKCIVEAEDIEKRSAIYNRAIEIMGVLRELNNFEGLLNIGSAIKSASIARLKHTEKTLTSTTEKIVYDYDQIHCGGHLIKLEKALKSCNPPCIPYLGIYVTRLIHIKEGNKTYIEEVATISPTLSNDEFNSSISNSPTTPISLGTPLPSYRYSAATLPYPSSANSTTTQNQFFGVGCNLLSRTLNPAAVGGNVSNGAGAGMVGSFSNSSVSTLMQQHQQQQPLTPAPPKMINFNKQSMKAKLVAEVGNYQNLPYCLEVQPEIRRFIESIKSEMIAFAESLNVSRSFNNNNNSNNNHHTHHRNHHHHHRNHSFSDNNGSIGDSIPEMTKLLDDYLFEQSIRIEPKDGSKPQRSKSKLPDSWKSPGIKVNNSSTPK